uniref:Uncharacterized protein n=1 Tax=Solanum tuberosum TaxID=4113 RepID=M1D281_SOLTU
MLFCDAEILELYIEFVVIKLSPGKEIEAATLGLGPEEAPSVRSSEMGGAAKAACSTLCFFGFCSSC